MYIPIIYSISNISVYICIIYIRKRSRAQRAQRAAVAEGLRRREAPAKTRAGEDQMRYSGTGKIIPSRRFSEFENDAFLLYRPQ